MAGKSGGEDQVGQLIMRADDAVVIQRVDLVMPGPGAVQPQLLHCRNTVREQRPERVLQQVVVRLVVARRVGITVGGGLDAADKAFALGSDPDAGTVEQHWKCRAIDRGAKAEHSAFAGGDRKVDAQRRHQST